MNWRLKNKIIHEIATGRSLYIKDTGVKVSVDYYGSDVDGGLLGRRDSNHRRSDYPCHVIFESIPTKKALNLCNKFHIKRNSASNSMEIDATINLEHLSLIPYESKGAKLLYEKTKKNN